MKTTPQPELNTTKPITKPEKKTKETKNLGPIVMFKQTKLLETETPIRKIEQKRITAEGRGSKTSQSELNKNGTRHEAKKEIKSLKSDEKFTTKSQSTTTTTTTSTMIVPTITTASKSQSTTTTISTIIAPTIATTIKTQTTMTIKSQPIKYIDIHKSIEDQAEETNEIQENENLGETSA